MKAALIIGLIELIALIIGFLFWHYGLIPGWCVPAFLLAPPVAVLVICIIFFSVATSNGGNPFR